MQVKFGARQAQIERQFQARRQASGPTSAPDRAPNGDEELPARYSTATDTLIGLQPLKFILWILLGAAMCGMAWRSVRVKHGATS